MNFPIDKKGREILVGDTLKIFHFIGARGKKNYMYKYVAEIVRIGDEDFYKVSHLNHKGEFFHMALDGKIRNDIEIVQGYGSNGISFDERIVKSTRDKELK